MKQEIEIGRIDSLIAAEGLQAAQAILPDFNWNEIKNSGEQTIL